MPGEISVVGQFVGFESTPARMRLFLEVPVELGQQIVAAFVGEAGLRVSFAVEPMPPPPPPQPEKGR